ncbi:MAG: hypothetical protein GEV03_11055 [Streptosporangiales bacterium]|nr:hypothetical protein [Streptosporangiales bacterium]
MASVVKLPARNRDGGEEGQVFMPVIFTAIVGILAITMLILQLGRAGDLRTRTQTAADAAALGAVAAIRDAALAFQAEGLMPYGTRYESAPDAVWERAREYARRNGAVLEDLQASGIGRTITVSVRSQERQGGSLSGARNSYARAKATAKVFFPGDCYVNDTGNLDESERGGRGEAERAREEHDGALICNGQAVTDQGLFASLFQLRLLPRPEPVLSVAGIPLGGASNGANQELGRRMAAQWGWTGAEWECLNNLWIGESRWNHLARNDDSGAYGIPQALPAEKMRSAGADWLTNPATQIAWGLDYIASRYGTPCGAWQFWLSQSPHWY